MKQALSGFLQFRGESHSVLDDIERKLFNGDKSGACQMAQSAGLWAHALIISSNMNPEAYQAVVANFVRVELSADSSSGSVSVYRNKPALKALYSIFSGSSKNAGIFFLLFSKVLEFLPSENKITENVNHWAELLALILANRNGGEAQVLDQLGMQLRLYRNELAAQIWYNICFN